MFEKTARFFVDLYICSRVFVAAIGNYFLDFQFWNTRRMEIMTVDIHVKTLRSKEENFLNRAEDFNGTLDTFMWMENQESLDDIIYLNFNFPDYQSGESFLMWSIFHEV